MKRRPRVPLTLSLSLSRYELELSKPYHRYVAIELLELASFREGCAFASLEYSPMPLEEPEPPGPRPSTVWQRFDGASLASHIERANTEVKALLAAEEQDADDRQATEETPIRLVNARFLMALEKAGSPLPSRNEVPEVSCQTHRAELPAGTLVHSAPIWVLRNASFTAPPFFDPRRKCSLICRLCYRWRSQFMASCVFYL